MRSSGSVDIGGLRSSPFPVGPKVRALRAAIVSEPERLRQALFG